MDSFNLHLFDMMTPQQRQDLAKYGVKAEIDCEAHERKRYVDFATQKEVDQNKNELALKRIDVVEQNRRNRENALIEIVQSADNKLYAIICYGQDFHEPIDCLYGRSDFSSKRFFCRE